MSKPAAELPRVQAWVKTMEDRFEGETGLHELVRARIEHFHNLPEADPFRNADGSIEEGKTNLTFAQMQTTRLRNVGIQLVGRLTENEWQPSIIPAKQTAAGQRDAEHAETIFQNGFSELQRRTGLNIQAALAQQIARDCFGVLHWQVDTSQLGDSPDYDELDELEEGDEKRFTEDEYPETVGKTKAKRYRESEDSLKDRIARHRAAKGLPVFVECPAVRSCYFQLGKYSNRGQFLRFMTKKEIPVEDYLSEKEELSDEREAPIEHNQGHTDTWMPSADDWGKTATLIQVWDSEYCYEICTWAGQNQPRFEVYKHPYKRPPFALALGATWHSTDPVLMYEPALAGMYRHKPHLDRQMSLFLALGEVNAMRRWFLQPDGKMPAMLQEDGDIDIDLGSNSSEAGVVPAGYKLEGYGGDAVVKDFVDGLAMLGQEMQDAAPGTGRATFGASTQPWAARIEQAQQNIEPKIYLNNIALAIQDMLQNLVEVFALPVEEGGPGEVFSWGSDQDRKLDRSKTVSLDPDGWRGLVAEVNINAVSAAEQITHEEHNRNLVNDPKIAMPLVEYLEKTGVPQPQQTYIKWKVLNSLDATVVNNLIRQATVEQLGQEFALGTDGLIVGAMGEPVPSGQFLNAVTAQQGAGRMAPQRPVQTTMPNMPAIQAPGTTQLGGLVG